MNTSAHSLWRQFKKEDHAPKHDNFTAWSLGNSTELADKLLTHVIQGNKTGTSSLYALYELEQEKIPVVGEYSVLLDGKNQAQAITQIKVIDVLPYNQISEVHGYLEGEGDRTLAYWRSVHHPYFEEECRQVGVTFSEEMLLVYELFEVVYLK